MTDATSPSIRRATREEAQLLATMIATAFRAAAQRLGLTAENCPTHPSNCTPAWIAEAMEKGSAYYLLESDGVACGCVAMERADEGVCKLKRLAVLAEHRRRGFGSALVRHVLAEARRLEARRVRLGVIGDDPELIRWYARFGFVARETARFPHLPLEVTFLFAEL